MCLVFSFLNRKLVACCRAALIPNLSTAYIEIRKSQMAGLFFVGLLQHTCMHVGVHRRDYSTRLHAESYNSGWSRLCINCFPLNAGRASTIQEYIIIHATEEMIEGPSRTQILPLHVPSNVCTQGLRTPCKIGA